MGNAISRVLNRVMSSAILKVIKLATRYNFTSETASTSQVETVGIHESGATDDRHFHGIHGSGATDDRHFTFENFNHGRVDYS